MSKRCGSMRGLGARKLVSPSSTWTPVACGGVAAMAETLVGAAASVRSACARSLAARRVYLAWGGQHVRSRPGRVPDDQTHRLFGIGLCTCGGYGRHE